MAILVVSEFSIFLSADLVPELHVDDSLDGTISINLDVVFHALPCAIISVNAMDKTGKHQLGIDHDVYTQRIDKDGVAIPEVKAQREVVGFDNKDVVDVDLDKAVVESHESECLSCYGAETAERPCCNTCKEVQDAYRKAGWALTDTHKVAQCVAEGFISDIEKQKEEGCRVHGSIAVSRVAGNFNIVPGKLILQNSRYVVDSDLYRLDGGFNVSHTVNHLSFGKEYPGRKNPLDGVSKIWTQPGISGMFEYFVKIVPTVYEDRSNNIINTSQFSVTEHSQQIGVFNGFQTSSGVPGFFVMYELSPVIVAYKESSNSFLHFIMHLCAIIGGVFTVASLIDSFLYSGIHTIRRKIDIGKQL
eukprot:TRINITY_DN1882_c0_g1_i4.p1 TRINITY_DN1882_c0_g1~~TRINITY_DN1882_c0_g1_i4.p1  ORF type:complete len:360 (+),score=55.91 TRINITY_DN1882_c0_g1_i4:153-1232(+)